MELTPRITETFDDERYDPERRIIRRVTVVTFKLGELGPFREEFAADELTEAELRRRVTRRLDALRNFT